MLVVVGTVWRMGRPSKLTPERQEAILGFIRAGVPNVRAAQLSGISETTFYEWLSKAQGKTEKNDARFPEFSESLKEAEAGFIESNLGVIRHCEKRGSCTMECPEWLAVSATLSVLQGFPGRDLIIRAE